MGRLPIPKPTRVAQALLRLLAYVLVVGAVSTLALGETVESAAQTEHATKASAKASAAAHAIDARAHRLAKDVSDGIVRVEPYLERYGYWAVFIGVGIEGMGIPAPGQTLLEAGALVSATPGSELNVYILLFVTILATSLGQTIGYLIGRTGERAILPRLPIPTRSLEQVERLFNNYGGWLVVFGRFVDGPRQLIGLFSGVLAMHWGRFMLLNLAGAVIWASFWTLGVYYLDLHLDAIVATLRHLNPWIAGLTLAGLGILVATLLILLIRHGLRRQT